ncbi:MAG: hypothetical protein QW567_04810, partial [Candidatus Hadarchaeales archaeon]
MAYQVDLISPSEKERLFEEYSDRYLYTKKANIYGCCIKLLTDLEDVRDLWEENFYTADENIRSHGRLVVLREEGKPMWVKYDPYTNTAFLMNVDYYGWIKSIALAVAGDVLEDEHGIYSVHGAAIDVGGTGVSIIAPPKTGKTTHSWGLLRLKESRLITDDWYFVRLHERGALAFGSEKNCYVEADIGRIWKEYEGILEKAMFDRSGRAIVNVRWAVGGGGVISMTTLRKIIMLKRESGDNVISRRLSTDEAMDYLLKNDFCNPHQLVRDERKLRLRRRFFERLFKVTDVFLVNTVRP